MVAAITIHFRKPELTAACIDSLLTDGWAPVLVWDNSADAGHSMQVLVNRYSNDPRVRLVANSSNLGFGKGMNAALVELGRRGYAGQVLLINNDAVVLPGMRSALLDAAPTPEPSPSLLAPKLLQNDQVRGWLYYHPWFALVTRRPLPGSFPYLSGCCLLVRRVDNTAPLFDEDFFMYGEDVELSWRVRKQGGSLYLVDHPWVVHEGSASSGQASEAYERFMVSSHWRLATKLADRQLESVFMRATRIPSLLLRACLRAIRYHSLTPIRALSNIR